MIRKVLIALAVTAFAGTSALAAPVGLNGATASKDKLTTSVAHGSSHFSAARLSPHKLDTIFDNVGRKYPKGLYFCCFGSTVSGSSSPVAETIYTAASFVAPADGKVSEIDAGVGLAAGTNSIVLGIAPDNDGVPGDLAGSGTYTGMGVFGDCCTLPTVTLSKSVKIQAGQTYWIVVEPTSADSDTWAAWADNSTDEVDPDSVAQFSNGAWTNFGASAPALSYAVLGKLKN
jgi:hypothetical protein